MPATLPQSLYWLVHCLACLCLCLSLPAPAQAAAQAPSLMLAHVWRSDLPLQDYWVSEKLDGVRGYWDGRQLISRGGQVIATPGWFTQGWPAIAMDGELWAGRGQFSHAQSTTAQTQPDDAAWRRMQFMVFDLPTAPGSFDERLPLLKQTVTKIGQPWVLMVAQQKMANEEQLQAWLRKVTQGGGEGLMLHKGGAPYRSGRSDDLLKLKPFDDAEARVIGYKPGRGQWQGMTGALIVQSPQGLQFALGTGLSAEQRKHPPPLGSWVTYRYQGLHEKSGLPRFARFMRVRSEPGFQPEVGAR